MLKFHKNMCMCIYMHTHTYKCDIFIHCLYCTFEEGWFNLKSFFFFFFVPLLEVTFFLDNVFVFSSILCGISRIQMLNFNIFSLFFFPERIPQLLALFLYSFNIYYSCVFNF